MPNHKSVIIIDYQTTTFSPYFYELKNFFSYIMKIFFHLYEKVFSQYMKFYFHII